MSGSDKLRERAQQCFLFPAKVLPEDLDAIVQLLAQVRQSGFDEGYAKAKEEMNDASSK